MGFFASIFGSTPPAKPAKRTRSGGAAPANHSNFHSSAASGFGTSSVMAHSPADARHQFNVRRDLLKVVLRDTLTRNGIPAAWIELQTLVANSGSKTAGVHARFVVKHWNPQIMMHAPGLEHAFGQRLMALDPLADQWLAGVSWQLSLADDVVLAPLPRPGSWTAHAHAQQAQQTPRASAGADVIEGPVRIGTGPQGAKADLQKLLAAGDADRRGSGSAYDATQPAPLD